MTPTRPVSNAARTALLGLAMSLLAACAGAGGPGGSPSSSPVSEAPAPTQVPGATTAPAFTNPDDPVAGGGSDRSGTPGGADPVEPQPSLVTPVAGLSGIHDVAASKLDAAVNGRDVAVRVSWASGVEPCTVLAGVDVARDGATFALTIREGSAAAPDTACIDLAQFKATIVDLGELDPGTYTVTAFGDAQPVTITVE